MDVVGNCKLSNENTLRLDWFSTLRLVSVLRNSHYHFNQLDVKLKHSGEFHWLSFCGFLFADWPS